MGIRKRGDKWLVTGESGRDELGVRRRVCRTVDTEDEAKRLDVKLQHDLYEGHHIKPSHESVASFVRRYLDDHEGSVAGSTFGRYEEILSAHLDDDLGRVSLAKFTPQVAARWKKAQLASGLAPATVHKQMTLVGAALELAVSWHLIAENPMRSVSLPDSSPPPFHVYSAAEQAALLSAAAPSIGDPNGHHRGRSEGSLYVPLILDLATGIRRGELLGLRTSDFDAKSGRIHVRQALTRRKDGSEIMGPCKTPRSRRTIVLPESVASLLARYASERPRVRSNVLLLNLKAQPFTLLGFSSSWRKVRSRAAQVMARDAGQLHDPFAEHAGDELEGARFHDLRHTHATELLRAGVHIKVVAERLGDSELTVMRTYSHVLPDMQDAAAAALEPMMRGLLPQGLPT